MPQVWQRPVDSSGEILARRQLASPGMDEFRFLAAPGIIIATERFVERVRRLALDGVIFQELEVR